MSKKAQLDIPILYEDNSCVVVNKPAGLMVHPDGRNEGPFLTDWLVARYPSLAGVGETQKTPKGEELERPGIVHRLDRDTSGVLLVAKTAEAHAFFKEQFQDRAVSKKYLAFVWGEMSESFGTIRRPIGRNSNVFTKWSAQRGARGEMREAETYWSLLWTGRIDAAGKPEKASLVQVEPKTGRTHQIRVHFLAVHHPVVSDHLYAPKRPDALGFERTALHAWKLKFAAMSGKTIEAIAPLPEDFQRAIAANGIKIA